MAYAAVICLKKTIDHLRNTSCMPTITSSFEINSAYEAVCFLKEELERLDGSSSSREEIDSLASQIREAAWKLEDVLDLHEINLDPDEEEEVKLEIRSFTEKAKKIEMECSKVEINFDHIEKRETLGTCTFLKTFCIVGMAGIGKTTCALKIFDDSKSNRDYDVQAFVTVGQKYQLSDVLLAILSQISPCEDQINPEEEVEELCSSLYQKLFLHKFLVVLDDVWDTWILKELSRFLPENNRGSQVLLTTRRIAVAKSISNPKENVCNMSFLSLEESWNLFCANVFQEGESCPHELVEIGKKITEYCEGLPLAIIMVAELISIKERTVEYWLKVANGETYIFKEASEKMSPVLFPSYFYLPTYLKQCFIYLGVFPCTTRIRSYKIVRLLDAEEFLDQVPDPGVTFEIFGMKFLDKLNFENVVISDDNDRDCILHFAFWHFCVKEAERSKFYKVIRSRADAFAEGIERERRLCIHNNVLFGMKDVCKSLSRISSARSILCTGMYHQHPMSIHLDQRLLKVLHAETIRFYEFPVQLTKLVQLKYLALTCSGKLPSSISKLRNLKYLIMKPHFFIRHIHIPMYLPMEIWDMKELKNLQIMGFNLPEPVEDALLENLSWLVGISGHTCIEGVLRRIPNLHYLGILLEISPCGTFERIGGFNNFHYLHGLEIVNCKIVNPNMSTPEVVPWPIMASSFPTRLSGLTLNGMGYPWSMMTNISVLPCLESLYLDTYAFRGSDWSVSKDGFLKLTYLSIEDTNLECWKVEEGAFPILRDLTLENCYKLKQLPKTVAYKSITKIKLVDCNTLLGVHENEEINTTGIGNPIQILHCFED